MCGRFALFVPIEQLVEEYALSHLPAFDAHYNLAPTQNVVAIRLSAEGERRASLLRWGLVPHWAKDPSIGNRMINARGETLGEKPAYRDAFKRRRCIVPASGFYEWGPSSAGKWPRFIHAKDGALLSLAGLWERWRGADGEPLDTCTIVTVPASATVAALHDRMPLCLPRAAYAAWLDRDTPPETCRELVASTAAPALELTPVSKTVNNPRNDDPRLVEPITLPPA